MQLKWWHSQAPLPFPKSTCIYTQSFKLLDSDVVPFIWGFKVHRISKKHTTKPKLAGGLSLPNFQHYYWAANSKALMYWKDAYPGTVTAPTPLWLAIEQDLPKSSLPALLFSLTTSPSTFTGKDFMVSS